MPDSSIRFFASKNPRRPSICSFRPFRVTATGAEKLAASGSERVPTETVCSSMGLRSENITWVTAPDFVTLSIVAVTGVYIPIGEKNSISSARSGVLSRIATMGAP